MSTPRCTTGLRRRGRRTSVLAFVTALTATALVVVGNAGASHLELTLAVEEPANIVNGVYLEVPVSVMCPADLASPPFTYVREQLVSVIVTQKAGRAIARGSGSFLYYDDTIFGGVPHGTPLTCDGTPHSVVINVFPAPGSPAFHGGKAVVQLNAYIDMLDPFGFFFDRSEATLGPQTLSIRG